MLVSYLVVLFCHCFFVCTGFKSKYALSLEVIFFDWCLRMCASLQNNLTFLILLISS